MIGLNQAPMTGVSIEDIRNTQLLPTNEVETLQNSQDSDIEAMEDDFIAQDFAFLDDVLSAHQLPHATQQLAPQNGESIVLSFVAGGTMALAGIALYRKYVALTQSNRVADCSSQRLANKYDFLDTQVSSISKDNML